MAETRRDPNEPVQLKFRCKEELRAKLEISANQRDTSINSEMIRRLESTFNLDIQENLLAELQGGWRTKRICDEITKAVRFFGADCAPSEEPLARSLLIGAVTQILNERLSGWRGLMSNPSSLPTGPEQLVELPPELEAKARSRGALIGHHITLATRAAEEQQAQQSLASESEVKGETLLQSAARLGLLDTDQEPVLDAPKKTTKKVKKAAQ